MKLLQCRIHSLYTFVILDVNMMRYMGGFATEYVHVDFFLSCFIPLYI